MVTVAEFTHGNPTFLWAQEKTGNEAAPVGAASTQKPSAPTNDKTRNFYKVLEDVLSDFEYDLKAGQVMGLKDLSLRNIVTSENVPGSFKPHLELLVTERIIRATRARIVQCLPCRSRRATLSGDNVMITSPDTNPAEQSRIAKMSGIQNFMDLAFAYQPTGMILSIYIIDAEVGTILFSRSYNSETSRAAAFRRGVDYSQVEEGRTANEYIPSIQYRPVIYYLFEPNVDGTTGVLAGGLRVVERYDNRKKEVGFEMNYMRDVSSITSSSTTSTTTKNLYDGINLTLLFNHGWNMIGEAENYNQVRGAFSLGVGGTYASGFLGGLVRAGYEWRMGKHWVITGVLGYRPTSTIILPSTISTTVSGVEFGLGIGALF